MPLTPKEILACARVMVRRKAPYLTTGVMSLIPKEMPGLGTMAVSEHMVLYWDPEYVKGLNPEEVMWDLLHEVSHVIRDHAHRGRQQGCLDPHSRKLWNHAGDAEINDDLMHMGAKHRVKYVLPDSIGCKEGGLAETYYHHLRQEQQKQDQKGAGDKPQCGAGWCGSGAGNPIPEEPDQKGQNKDAGRSGADVQRVKQQVAEAIRQQAQQSRGSVPAGWQIWADELLKPAKIPWQKKLARAVRNAVAERAGAVNYSYSRPSRRQAMFGFGKGHPVMPTLRSPVPRVAVGLDTSGSMGKDEIARAAAEITGVLKATRTEVGFIACDCRVHTVTKIKHPRQFADVFRGGGGTSFVPVFDALADFKKKPDLFIFITDGQGAAPHMKPDYLPHMIWVLVGPHKCKPSSDKNYEPIKWGEMIEIDDEPTTGR